MINIAILGSTGSIGLTTLNVVRLNKSKFKILLLSANLNAAKLFSQAKEFNVKNVIILNSKKNHKWIKKFHNHQINTYDNFSVFKKIFKKKLDYVINAITGIDGLQPTLNIIKYTNKIAIANKESIICGWNLIKKKLLKHKTLFIPVDSEHFSIYELIKNKNYKSIKKIIITASGGPFLNKKNKKKIKINDALKHPNWKMGKKITIDSSTLMNKVFEVIEAKKIFNLNMNKIDIIINPNSYLHAIVIFNNGIIKLLAHETRMDIPIFNSIYDNNKSNYFYNTKELNFDKINNLKLSKPDKKRFEFLNILKLIPNNDSLFETVLITVNDELVSMFLKEKIDFKNISIYLMKIINFKSLKKYYKIKPNSVHQILKVRNYARNIVIRYVDEKN
tara:strand:+ start:1289 stop:2458 length:1170 start_codon:yes stop_codon:yes gene_type:complete